MLGVAYTLPLRDPQDMTIRMRERNIFFIFLECEAREIREKTKRSNKDNGSDECIDEDILSFFHAFLISSRRDIVICTIDDEEYSNRSRKEECKTEYSTPHTRYRTCEITPYEHTNPAFYEKEEHESYETIGNTSFCEFGFFFITAREYQLEKPPCQHQCCCTISKYTEESDNIANKTSESCLIPESRSIRPTLTHDSLVTRASRGHDFIEESWDIEE